jgi:hypothetical protein
MGEAAAVGRGAVPRPAAAALERTAEHLGLHHFAYVRVLAEGVPVPEAAARYLHIDHARAARSAHRVVIERARALARRLGYPAWRLVGIEIRLPSAHAAPAQAGAGAALPSLDEWAADQGFDGFRESELLELYTEAFGLAGSGPAAPAEDNTLRRRRQRAGRLRQRQLQALRVLEAAAAQPARMIRWTVGCRQCWSSSSCPPACARSPTCSGALRGVAAGGRACCMPTGRPRPRAWRSTWCS